MTIDHARLHAPERFNARAVPATVEEPATVTLRLNGREVQARPGETVFQLARRHGVDIPTLCHDDRLEPTGACRMCLVQTSDSRRMVPSCRHPVSAGLEVQTESASITRHRQALLALYAVDQPRGMAPGSELDVLARRYGVEAGLPADFEGVAAPRAARPMDLNKFVAFDPDHCILCARCTRYCDEVEAVSAITLAHRGPETTISTADAVGLLDSTCELCGGCIDTCPTGAMYEALAGLPRERPAAVSQTRTTCNYCGVGCQMDINVEADTGKVIRVTSPAPGETTNDGNLCVKGRFAYGFIDHPERLKVPLIRGEDGELHETDWDTALERAATLMLGVKERHGADAMAFVSSSRCTNEENYLVQKLARAGFGTHNVHQCAAT